MKGIITTTASVRSTAGQTIGSGTTFLTWQIRMIRLSCMTCLTGQSRFRTPFGTMWHRVCLQTVCLLLIGSTTAEITKWKTIFHAACCKYTTSLRGIMTTTINVASTNGQTIRIGAFFSELEDRDDPAVLHDTLNRAKQTVSSTRIYTLQQQALPQSLHVSQYCCVAVASQHTHQLFQHL